MISGNTRQYVNVLRLAGVASSAVTVSLAAVRRGATVAQYFPRTGYRLTVRRFIGL